MARIDSPLLDKSQTYLGNALLKKSGVKTKYTEEMIAEFARCSEDVIYFVKTYCRIISLEEGEVPFQLF